MAGYNNMGRVKGRVKGDASKVRKGNSAVPSRPLSPVGTPGRQVKAASKPPQTHKNKG